MIRHLAAVAATGMAYAAAAQLMWHINAEWGSAFWPGAGITLAALVHLPPRWWPLVLAVVGVAEFSVSRSYDMTVATAGWGAVANTVEPLIGATIFRRFSTQGRLVDLRSVLWLVLGGALAGPAVGALFGGLLAVSGPAPGFERWLRWCVGDGVGVLAVTPLLIMRHPEMGRVQLNRQWAEVLGIVAATGVVVDLLVMPGNDWSSVSPYLAVPVMVWAALRFGVFGAAAVSTVIAVTVHAATATGHGAFVDALGSELVVAQTFIGVTTISTLTLAVLTEDVARRRVRERELLHRALHDPLTSLANRAGLEAHLDENRFSALVVVDLDGFKGVNDCFGHSAGDAVLRDVADRLVETCRAGDVVARLGGDEFVVVVSDLPEDGSMAALADRLRDSLLAPFDLGGQSCRIGASVGVVLADGVSTVNELLMTADRRMYRDKLARTGLDLHGAGSVPNAAQSLDVRAEEPEPASPGAAPGWEDAGTA